MELFKQKSLRKKILGLILFILIFQNLVFFYLFGDSIIPSNGLLFLGSSCLLFTLAYFALDAFFKPLQSIIETLKVAGKRNLSLRVDATGFCEEFADLATHFNQTLDRIEKLVSRFRETVEHLAHDIRNPITNLRTKAEAALNNHSIEVYEEAMGSCHANAGRILKLIDDLSDITLLESRDFLKCEIPAHTLISEIINLYEIAFEEKKIKLSISYQKNDLICVNANLIRRVFANLIDNALKYTPEGGTVWISTQVLDDQKVLIRIGDSGCGIPKQDLVHIWDRHFRSQKAKDQAGLGLGLSFVKSIIEAHNGSIKAMSPWVEAKTSLNEIPGTLIEILLPQPMPQQ